MKALSVRQPWAHLIITGIKDIENRTWRTTYRGPILIHAGKTFDADAYDWVRSEMCVQLPPPCEIPRGGIVGCAWILGCTHAHPSPWFTGPWGWVLDPSRAELLPFAPCPGRLGLFEASEVEPSGNGYQMQLC